jgi:hypothetical protein
VTLIGTTVAIYIEEFAELKTENATKAKACGEYNEDYKFAANLKQHRL